MVLGSKGKLYYGGVLKISNFLEDDDSEKHKKRVVFPDDMDDTYP